MFPTPGVIACVTAVGLKSERCAVRAPGGEITDKVGLKLKELAFRTNI